MSTTPLCTEWCTSEHEGEPIARDGYFQCGADAYSDDVVEVKVWHAVDSTGPITPVAQVSIAPRDLHTFDALNLTADQALKLGAAVVLASVCAQDCERTVRR